MDIGLLVLFLNAGPWGRTDSFGALIIRTGFPTGVYKGSIVGFYDIGALIIGIGFWGML